MLKNGIAHQLINGIPSFLGEKGIEPTRTEMLRVVQIPTISGIINFDSDVWDARKAFTKTRSYMNVIHFKNCHPETKDLIKGFAAQELDDGKKVSTLHGTIPILSRTINAAIEASGRCHFLFISTKDILDGMDRIFSTSDFDKLAAFPLVNRFLEFARTTAGIRLNVDEKEIRQARTAFYNQIKGYRKHKPIPDIPDEYFDLIINKCDEVMRDETLPLNDRLIAGIVLIDSQLGLRISEVVALEVDCRDMWPCNDGVVRPYIVYNSIKASRGDVESLPVKTFCNAICDEALEYYIELRKQSVYANETDFLYIQDPRYISLKNNEFPISPNTFNEQYQRFFGRYLREEARKNWGDITRIHTGIRGDDETLCIPSIHSFRKHFCSALAKAGIHWDYIDAAISHTPYEDLWDSYGVGVKPPSIQVLSVEQMDSVIGQRGIFDKHMNDILNNDIDE